ncbi:MAG: DUF6434 domain-containing protein [Melioribacteraceae bacterium]
MNHRPKLEKNIKIEDFRDFYWLKGELIEFCRIEGLVKRGGKIEISNRIEKYLTTGIKTTKTESQKSKSISKLDWNNEELTLQTVITDNYKNTENVRIFFAGNIGKKFKFNVKFMNWMKLNIGLTLENAVKEWRNIEIERKNNKSEKEIKPQFEYNRYIRDFLKNNTGKTRNNAIEFWNIKKTLRGNNNYEKSDLDLEMNK